MAAEVLSRPAAVFAAAGEPLIRAFQHIVPLITTRQNRDHDAPAEASAAPPSGSSPSSASMAVSTSAVSSATASLLKTLNPARLSRLFSPPPAFFGAAPGCVGVAANGRTSQDVSQLGHTEMALAYRRTISFSTLEWVP